MSYGLPHADRFTEVSIPMTVLGGLQCDGRRTCRARKQVSIPMTVLGGLQYLLHRKGGRGA